ncbi:MAG: phage virion morphogenesis protein [Deltaproteobacteria bacterium]|nr:phage virion morphogenesis protein [Deltaproteobacteria bacterium]
MAGVEIKVDTSDLEKLLSGLLKRMDDLSGPMAVLGETVLASIQENFEAGGRPTAWEPLAPSTIEERTRKDKWPGRILVRTGGLTGSISYEAFSDKAVVSANKVYAAIHHFGGKAGRGRKTTIPARPFMMIQDEDLAEMQEAIKDYILEART